MDVYKHFVAGLRNVTLSTVYIILNKEDISVKLLNYVKFLNAVKYEDGMYHTYYGEIKRLVDSFVAYWTETMDETMKEADELCHVIDKKKLLDLIHNTIHVRTMKSKIFETIFLPIETPDEQILFDDLVKKYTVHIEKLYKMLADVEKFYKQEQLDAFARENFPISVTKKNEVFEFAHTYISMLLADHLPEIRGSIKEILQRRRNNLQQLHEQCERSLHALLHQLYDKHKELLAVSRRGDTLSHEAAEINKSIDKIRKQVIRHSQDAPISMLRHEELYFEKRIKEFEQIAATLHKLKAELEDVQREEAVYYSMTTTELPGSKQQCWQNMAKNYADRKEFAKVNLIKAAKALLTFFCVRGPNWMLYRDAIGPYHIDEYGHQVYHFDSGLRTYHLDCSRNYKEKATLSLTGIGSSMFAEARMDSFDAVWRKKSASIIHRVRGSSNSILKVIANKHDCPLMWRVTDETLHWYDDKGRYIIKDGEKIYQVMPCTSSYKLGEDTLLKKVTVDCGHSESLNPDCGMQIKDLTDVEILPKTEPMDITRSLKSEVVRYLWDAVGAALPPALHDVGALQPRNPVHYLAHRLLVHKYGKTTAEYREMKQKAEAYRAKIFRDRKEKAIADAKAWKAKQVKRRKPEESDDAQEKATYELYTATNEFIQSLNFYN